MTRDADGLMAAWGAPAAIIDHHRSCCSMVRDWLDAMHASIAPRRMDPPVWLRERFPWGPLTWPVAWCDIPRLEMLDCGATTAITNALYRAQGVRATPVQLVYGYRPHVVDLWRARWSRDGCATDWLAREHVYHEASALLGADRRVVIWDSTVNRWLHLEELQSHPLIAVRVWPDERADDHCFWWDEQPLYFGRWYRVGAEAKAGRESLPPVTPLSECFGETPITRNYRSDGEGNG